MEAILGKPRRTMTPLNRRRLENFKRNRRGYWSFWLFLVLFGISLLAEVIANDKPILVIYDGNLYVPILRAYPETEFGGFFPTEAEYRDPVVQELILEKGSMIWPLVPYSYDTIDRELGQPAPSPPDSRHWLGTDDQARDVVARMIYGFRLSVLFGLLLTGISSVIGIAIGAIQGFYGGWTDLLGQRLIEVWSGMPTLYVLIIVSSLFAPSFFTILLVLLLFSWTALVGVVRAEFLRARNFDFVRAARALGVSNSVIMVRHVLPNAMVATLTMLPFLLNAGITSLTSLDVVGYGLPPGSPSLGELLLQGRNNVDAPWLGITGFMTLAVMLTLLIFVGEAVRDAFDPRKTFSS